MMDIGFNPTANDIYPNSTRGFFDGVLNPSSKSVVSGEQSFSAPPAWGRNLALAAGGIQMYGQTQSSLANIDNIMANVHRTEMNIEQIELEMMDTLDIQARKVSTRHGTQMARIGASGVGFSGSPLLVMATTHARGMQDYDAIEQKGRYAITDAYRSIYDSLDQAEDIANSIFLNSVTTLAGSVYGYNRNG